MKVNGTDSIIKLLLGLKNQNIKMPASGEKMNSENSSNQVEEIITLRDEVILRGDSLLKPEILFTRQLHETSEIYLQRISSEMIKMKESQNILDEKQHQRLHHNDDTVDIALRAGLQKEYVNQDKLKKGLPRDGNETICLLIFSVSFIVLLTIYLIFRK